MARKANIGAGISLDGEKEFKQAITGINKDLGVLGSEMKKVTSQFADNKGSVEALTAKDEVLNKQMDTQREKVDAIRKALENSKTQYGENDNKTKEWQKSLNNAEADLYKLDNELKANKSALEQSKNPADNLGNEIKKVGDNAEKAGQKTLSMGDIIKANLISQAIISGVKSLANSFVGLAKGALDSADSIQQMSDVTGMSAETIQEWQYVGDTLGTSIDTITAAQAKLTKSMGSAKDATKGNTLSLADQKLKTIEIEKAQKAYNEALKEHGKNSLEAREAGAKLQKVQENTTQALSGTAAAFAELGVDIYDLHGGLRDAQETMGDVFDALAKVENPTKRDALAMQIFGKSAMDLNPLIKAGSDEISRLSDEAKKSGAVMSNETVSGLDNFGDSLGQLKQSLTGMAGTILDQVMPNLQGLIDKVKNIDTKPIIDALKWIIDNSGNIISGVAGIGAALITWNVVSMVTGLVKAIKKFQLANEGATIAQAALNLVMNANPIGIIITVVAGLVAAVITLWKTNEGFRTAVINIFNTIKTTVLGVANAIANFFNNTIPNALNSAVSYFKSLPGKITATISSAVSGMASIGTNLVHGIWNGISDATDWIMNKIRSFGSNIVVGIKNIFGIKSPSTLMRDEVGKYLAQGIGVGFTDQMQKVTSDMTNAIPTSFDTSLNVNTTNSSTKASNIPTSSGNVRPIYYLITNLDGREIARTIVDPISEELEIKRKSANLAYGGDY